MSNKRLGIYLAVTFGLSWGLWIPAGILTGSYQNGLESSQMMMGIVALGMFFPLVGALIANAAVPKDDRFDLHLRPQIRSNIKYYLLAWFMPAVVTLVGSTLFFLVFPQLFDASVPQVKESLEQAGMSQDLVVPVILSQILSAITLAPLINAIPGFGEEVGWRGMLYPTLCEQMSPRKAVLVHGVIWGLWHAPITAMGHNYGRDYVGFPVLGIVVMIVFCTSIGCLLCWLIERSKSIWTCAVAHGAINAILNTGVVFCSVGQTLFGPSPAGLVAGLPLLALAIVCWRRMPDDASQQI